VTDNECRKLWRWRRGAADGHKRSHAVIDVHIFDIRPRKQSI